MTSEHPNDQEGNKSVQNDTPTKKDGSEEVKSPPVSNYWRILSFGTRFEHTIILIGLASSAASGVALPLMQIVFGNLVGNFNNYFIPGSGVTESQFKSSVSKNALYILYLFIGKFVLTYIGLFCFRITGLRISAALRLSYLQSLFAQPVKKLDEVSAGTVANTITTSANTIQLSITDRLAMLFQSLALVIAAYAVAFRYSWALTLVTSSAILFVVIAYSFITPFALKVQHRFDKAEEKHATVSAEVFSSIRTVFALCAEPKLTDKHSQRVEEAHNYGIKGAPWLALQFIPIFFATYAAYALAFWFGLKLYREGHIGNVSTVIIVFFSVLIVTGVMGAILHPIMNINKAISASSTFFEMIDSDRVQFGGLKEPAVSAHADIVLDDITFAYPTRPNVKVLKNFSATFHKGKTTALVGPSGSGKSTIVALLERWYDLQGNPVLHSDPYSEKNANDAANKPGNISSNTVLNTTDGSITADGLNVNKFDLKWWRSQIGLVQQEPFLFNDTIERNVAFGLMGTEWENAESAKKLQLVKEACKEAFADEFISKLPQGYSSVVGEGGIKLSGGQRQRIAIARSIIRKPAILILDEATSSIDVQSEKIVQEALDRVSKNRTTITIAHRLSTIRKADHIIVLRDGAKVEEGTNEQLLSNLDGLYSSLVQAQMIEEDTETSPQMENLGSVISRQKTVGSRTEFSQTSETITHETPATGEDSAKLSYKRKGFFRSVGVLIYEQKKHWVFYCFVLLAAMGCGAANSLQSWLFAQLVQTFQFTGQKLVDAANHWALMFFILALGVSASYALLGFCSGFVSVHAGTYSKQDYFRNTIQMPISYFDKQENASGSIMSRLSGDPKQIQDLLGYSSAFPLIACFNLVGCIILAFYFGWKLTLVTVFSVMPIVILAYFIRVRFEVKFEKMNAEVFSSSSQFATEAIGAFRTVSSLTMEDSIIEKYRSLLHEQIKKSTFKASYAMLVYALSDSIELCGMALTFWYGGQLLASREYQPLQFYVIYSAVIQGSQAAGQYLSITPNIAYSTASANRMLEVRKLVSENSNRAARDASMFQTALGAKVDFKDVTFGYDPDSVPLFCDLNISIEAGQFAAFVGASGCGKTTTISLLERFYDPTSGTILIDGKDTSTLSPSAYRQGLSLVAQEPRLFSGTIRENLLLGVNSSNVSEEGIIQACRDAEIHDFIISLPEGYGTDLGLNTQTTLSGGQKQRLCLARALLRKPKLLLLDEATSSLDSQSERLVQKAIERLAGQRSMTVIAVAHRLATIQKADVIFVFAERDIEGARGSKIIEKGTHSELLGKRGVYWSMCEAQALDR